MRAATLPLLALPLLLTYCGAQHDLIIGEVDTPPIADGGSSVIPSAGSGAEPATGGNGGSGGVSGNGGVAGTGGDTPDPALGGSGGEGGSELCPLEEQVPLEALLHRYSFDGLGTELTDSIGDAHGNLVNGAMLDDSGVLTLPGNREGQPDQYANLPNGLISSLSEVTFVVWTTWKGGAGYERILDFGVSDQGEQQGGSGRSYIAVMTSNGFANGMGLGAEITAPGFATLQLASTEDIEDVPSQVALVFRSGVSVGLYLDAKLLIESPTPIKLSNINDVNNWLGESQWSKDHPYGGSYDEFRIYDVALSACQLATLFARGPATP